MTPVKPTDANCVLMPPKGHEDTVVPLHVYRYKDPETGVTQVYSLWEPTEKERLMLLSGLPVMLCIVGEHFPPVGVTVAANLDRITYTDEQLRQQRKTT